MIRTFLHHTDLPITRGDPISGLIDDAFNVLTCYCQSFGNRAGYAASYPSDTWHEVHVHRESAERLERHLLSSVT